MRRLLYDCEANLDAGDIIAGEVELRPVSLVAGEHDGAPHVGVLQPQAVPDLVHCNLCEVDALEAAQGPELVVVEVDVPRGSALLGEESVGQRPARLVEGVSVPMVTRLEPEISYQDPAVEGRLTLFQCPRLLSPPANRPQ